MVNIPTEIIKIARPVHWVKNLALFAALIFSRNLGSEFLFEKVVIGFIAFCLATSSAYIFNDILDVESDKLHPLKKSRPVAAGSLPIPLAIGVMVIFSFAAVLISYSINSLFFLLVISYILLQIFYSLILKNIPIIDILVIAAGFIIRVYAGAFIIDAHLSVWFLLCVISVSLFLASGKRRAELNIKTSGVTRKSLSNYSRVLLNSYVTMFGNAAWMSWALFTFFESPTPSTPLWLFLAEISRTTTISKLLMLTIPVVIFGIMRYENLIFEGQSEAPEKLLLTDKGLIMSVFIWLILIVWILYGGVTLITLSNLQPLA